MFSIYHSQQSAWIDINDRLPLNNEAALACIEDGSVLTVWYLSDDHMWNFVKEIQPARYSLAALPQQKE